MAKKIVQDVLPPERSIRNIPLSTKTARDKEREEARPRTRRTASSSALNTRTRSGTERTRTSSSSYERSGDTTHRNRLVLWSLAVLCFLGVVYACSFLFTSATVTITPKQWPVAVHTDLQASKESDTLPYSLITVSREVTRTVPASGQESVQKKAVGSITIFNTQAQAQKLVANTRFESSSGLIFRIAQAVTVPGATTKAGTSIPGSVTVKITADKAGPLYNIGLADFTIPGFKGDPKYKTVTAKSDPTAPVAGGFIGMVSKVKDTDLQVAYAAMEKELRDRVIAEVAPQVPATQIFFPSTSVVSFEKTPVGSNQASSTPGTATVSEKATLTGVLFDRTKLTAALASSFPAEATKIPVDVADWSGLTFTFKTGSDALALKSAPIQFTLQGNVLVVGHISTDDIQARLAGVSRSSFVSQLAQVPAIAKAELAVKPIWAFSFPKNPAKISIIITGQK